MATVAEGGKVPPVELECPVVGCTLGENGERYKTPPVPGTGITEALQLLTMHNQNHAQAQGVAVGHGAGGESSEGRADVQGLQGVETWV